MLEGARSATSPAIIRVGLNCSWARPPGWEAQLDGRQNACRTVVAPSCAHHTVNSGLGKGIQCHLHRCKPRIPVKENEAPRSGMLGQSFLPQRQA